jgi:hypothetical protein
MFMESIQQASFPTDNAVQVDIVENDAVGVATVL